MKIKNIVVLLLLAWSFSACFDDKGNYDYHDIAEISIENIPEVIEVLGGSDHIVVKPKVTSSLEGEIKDGNPNFEFAYKIEIKSGGTILPSGEHWVDLNPSKTLFLDTPASFSANTYIGWFSVTDTRTGRQTSATFDIKVSTPTYEGWMVLCNEGEENRVRMDMISVISADRIVPAYDLLTSLGLPPVNNATSIGFGASRYSQGDLIYVLSKEGAFKLDKESFKTGESWSMYLTDFIIPRTGENIVSYKVLSDGFAGAAATFCVSDIGNAYAQLSGAGAAFEMPINTSARLGKPEYRVSPYIGLSMARPANGRSALFYDIDNKRFVGWTSGQTENSKQILTPLPDPENKMFSFRTDMEMVYMESTRYSGGLVYSILKDAAGKHHIYGINMSGNGFVQESKYENVNATDFDKATAYAFHSQFPYLFYAAGNKVYLYHLGTGVTYPMSNIALGANEEVTLLKFNLYEQPRLTDLNNKSDEFMARQFELMVGSYDKSVAGVNGGKLGFYPVNGANNSVTKRTEYAGFAKIKDVVYRERR